MMPAREWAYFAAFLLAPWVPIWMGMGWLCGGILAWFIAVAVCVAFNAGKPQ
jgi:hypothetical protein